MKNSSLGAAERVAMVANVVLPWNYQLNPKLKQIPVISNYAAPSVEQLIALFDASPDMLDIANRTIAENGLTGRADTLQGDVTAVPIRRLFHHRRRPLLHRGLYRARQRRARRRGQRRHPFHPPAYPR